MTGKFSMDDYVDVAERIRVFHEKYPEGSLQSSLTYMADPAGWFCIARAYRTPDDVRPGVGHAFEPVPGKTPYTRDSEAMNAETSAWGRAIVALGFETKKIASAQEVNARQGDTPVKQPRQRSRKPTNPPLPPSKEQQDAFYTPTPITPAQLARLLAGFKNKGMEDKNTRLAFAAQAVGREIASSKDLTKSEATRLIDQIEGYDPENPDTYPFPESS